MGLRSSILVSEMRAYKVAYTDQTLLLFQAVIPVTAIGKVYEAARNTRAWRFLKGATTRAIRLSRDRRTPLRPRSLFDLSPDLSDGKGLGSTH